MRIAVASTDGRTINVHFGQADSFSVYDVTEDEIVPVEQRAAVPFCQGGYHLEGDLKSAIEQLADCQMVFAAKIGYGAKEQLAEAGITAVEAPG